MLELSRQQRLLEEYWKLSSWVSVQEGRKTDTETSSCSVEQMMLLRWDG